MKLAPAMCLISSYTALLCELRFIPDAALAWLFLAVGALIQFGAVTAPFWRPRLRRMVCGWRQHVWHQNGYFQRCTRCRTVRWVIPGAAA